MKKVLLTLGIILIALSIMAPAPDKAEKLKHEGNGWDREGQQFVIKMFCKFGIATAGEHANFTTLTELTINAGEKTYYLESIGDNIQKVAGADNDADGYIEIEPTKIAWDREGFEGVAKTEASITLLSPSGNVMGDAVIGVDDVTIEPPGDIPGGDPCEGDDCP